MKTLIFALGFLASFSLVPLFGAAAKAKSYDEHFINARMVRYPDVSATQIAFVYGGDIWVVPKTGGLAQRLSSPRGEETFPRFSPDGNYIAFSGNYDGNTDVYVIGTSGGLPKRVTHHGATDRVVDWHPNGKEIILATRMTSQKDRFNQLYTVSAAGGLPKQLPVPYGEFGSISADGKTLAYIPISVDFSTWKRYRGGMNPDIWLFNLENNSSKNLTQDDANDAQPMWHKSTLYFLSDRDVNKRANIWAYDTKKDKLRQVTNFEVFDVKFPSIGPDELVFENGGRLFLLDLRNDKTREVNISVITDQATLKPKVENVSSAIRSHGISPSAKRAVVEARGDIFTIPAENGIIRNLTRSSGIAERHPAWSPDGKHIAYFTDRSGEYELAIRPSDGSGSETLLTQLGEGFRYYPQWSPDSKKIVWIDQTMKIHLYDFETKETRFVDKQMWMYHGALNNFRVSWSSDSRYITYSGDLVNRNSAIVIYDTKENKRHQVTSGFYNDETPVFDPGGKYLYYLTGRNFDPVYSDLDNTWVYPNSFQIAAIALKKDGPSPLPVKNDEEIKKDEKENEKKDEVEKEEAKDSEKKEDKTSEDTKANDDKKSDARKEEKKEVAIDFEDFERRAYLLPIKPGYYSYLQAIKGKIIYRRNVRAGSDESKTPILIYDVEKKEEKQIIDDASRAVVSAKGDKMLLIKGSSASIVDAKENQNMSKRIATASVEVTVDPKAEWKQLFTEAWRLQRDYFYDPGLHGVNWKTMRGRYSALIDDAITRWDINYILGELIGELNSSHTYRSGGDTESSPSRGVGYLGVDFTLEDGFYRIKKILEGAAWDAEARSPLRRNGVDVKEGDYLIAVNGEPVDTSLDPWAAFQGLADKPVFLSVNSQHSAEGAREVLVQTLGSEYRLRHLAWIEENRKKVESATSGRVGYVYVPDTGRGGQAELVRQYRGQVEKEGMIIDERFNSGGQIPDRFVEFMNRPLANYWGVRDGRDWDWPPAAHHGPKVMLINGWSGSGGDAFPYYFKQAGVGPLIGTRTWGGLIGMTGSPNLIDGGSVTVPTFGIYDPEKSWIIENEGVEPDIKVVDDPALMVNGGDPQLDRAIEEVLKLMQQRPPLDVRKPKYPMRAGN